MATEVQKKARDKYNSQRKHIMLDFAPTEMELYEHIKSQPKIQTYIKDLIRADIDRSSG